MVANCFLEEVELTDLERNSSVPLCKHFHQSTRYFLKHKEIQFSGCLEQTL